MSRRVIVNEQKLNGFNLYNTTPIGTILPFAGEVIPNGFFICDGRSLSKTEYAKLYSVIGYKYTSIQSRSEDTFNIPDLREVTLVGAGQNEKLNIKEHDVYNIGEFKDDQMQGHWHWINGQGGNSSGNGGVFYEPETSANVAKAKKIVTDNENGIPRVGLTTHGKQIGVNYIIKAIDTSGIVPSDIQLNDQKTTIGNVWSADKTKREINAKNNYSENEKVVGTFLDKPLYRKVFSDLNINIPSDTVTTLLTDTTIETVDDLILCIGIGTEKSENSKCTTTFTKSFFRNGSLKAFSNIGFTINKLILEYTKTTD